MNGAEFALAEEVAIDMEETPSQDAPGRECLPSSSDNLFFPERLFLPHDFSGVDLDTDY